MALSDEISRFIRDIIRASNGVAELQRVELAGRFCCAPSQINYVIATRFAPEQGFLVESRRGGGGYIRITRVSLDKRSLLMHALNTVSASIDARSAAAYISNLLHAEAINAGQAALLRTVTCDNALRPVPQPVRDEVRASIFKQSLLVLTIDTDC